MLCLMINLYETVWQGALIGELKKKENEEKEIRKTLRLAWKLILVNMCCVYYA